MHCAAPAHRLLQDHRPGTDITWPLLGYFVADPNKQTNSLFVITRLRGSSNKATNRLDLGCDAHGPVATGRRLQRMGKV